MRLGVVTGTRRSNTATFGTGRSKGWAAVAGQSVDHFKFLAKFTGDCDWSLLSPADIFTSKWELMTRFIVSKSADFGVIWPGVGQ